MYNGWVRKKDIARRIILYASARYLRQKKSRHKSEDTMPSVVVSDTHRLWSSVSLFFLFLFVLFSFVMNVVAIFSQF